MKLLQRIRANHHKHAQAAAVRDENVTRSHGEIMVIISALIVVMLLAALDQTIVSTALPAIANDLNGLGKYSWVATAYLLTSAISTPLYGKISDMFGRKRILQIAILIFLFGSILCGFAQSMEQLIIFRGIQGLGAGGLMTLVFATIGDVVPARERGKYQGYFGAVFAVSSVLGPLLGGLFTDQLSWRWVFWINIPLGLAAMAAIALRLHLPVRSSKHKIDFTGAGLLSLAISSLLLATVWGGVEYAWSSVQILGLIALSILTTGLFIRQEGRAAEPIIPLGLFKNKVFRVICIMSTMVGVVMFGAIIFIPEYQQIVRGDSATKSGLMMLPLVLGIMAASLISGRLISKLGKYRRFPIIGSSLLILSFVLFTNIAVDTNRTVFGIWMFILGLGIGQIMPVLTLAAQNAVDRKDLGTATATVVFFRNIGSTLGAAMFGSVLVSRLTHYVTNDIPGQAGVQLAAGLKESAASLAQASQATQDIVLNAFANAFSDVFLLAIPFAVITLIVALQLPEIPLKGDTNTGSADPESMV